MLKKKCENEEIHKQTNAATAESWNRLVSTDWLVDWFFTLTNNYLIERTESNGFRQNEWIRTEKICRVDQSKFTLP